MISQIISWLISLVINLIKSSGLFGIFALMSLESANIPIPSEVIMPFSGFLVSKGIFGFWSVVFVGALGNLFGSVVSYWLASAIVNNRERVYFLRILISEKFLEKSKIFFEKYGSLSVLISRVMPILRTFISLPAGIGKMKFFRFCYLTFIGSFVWSLFLAYLGKILGDNWNVLEKYFRQLDLVIVLVIILAGIYWAKKHFNLSFGKKRIK